SAFGEQQRFRRSEFQEQILKWKFDVLHPNLFAIGIVEFFDQLLRQRIDGTSVRPMAECRHAGITVIRDGRAWSRIELECEHVQICFKSPRFHYLLGGVHVHNALDQVPGRWDCSDCRPRSQDSQWMKTSPRWALLVSQKAQRLAYVELLVSHKFHSGQSRFIQSKQCLQCESANVDIIRLHIRHPVSRDGNANAVQQVGVMGNVPNFTLPAVNAIALDETRNLINRSPYYFR